MTPSAMVGRAGLGGLLLGAGAGAAVNASFVGPQSPHTFALAASGLLFALGGLLLVLRAVDAALELQDALDRPEQG